MLPEAPVQSVPSKKDACSGTRDSNTTTQIPGITNTAMRSGGKELMQSMLSRKCLPYKQQQQQQQQAAKKSPRRTQTLGRAIFHLNLDEFVQVFSNLGCGN
mmetsp:Transcript_31702/g.56949  ORF Transcript_31702/g.56949 Transcript_31702/m.56949 type:complete len:101 (+) Transcript_31702:96-398(+)